ncbi:hypothetical protein MOUN0_E03884 [Monosporozyma unispora]|nr:BAR domain-containing protein [Kazachstania unispora]
MSSFNNFASTWGKKLEEISTTMSQKAGEISTNLPAMAQSTQRMVQERLGQVTDISQLPQEYLELEKKIDSLKLINQHFLQITSIYENESYDYPKFIRDSVNDLSKTVTTKVTDLSRATSTTEAQNIIMAPGPVKDPKTLNYALSKVALTSSELINKSSNALTPEETQVSSVLLDFSNLQTQVAQARIQQDTMIKTKFNKRLRETLEHDIERAEKARKEVSNKRLQYDVARTNLMNAKPEKEASLRVQMESLEDQFAQVTEHATIVMQEVLANSEFLTDLQTLVKAQLSYFEMSSKLLTNFLDNTQFPDPTTSASAAIGSTPAASATPTTTAETTPAQDNSPIQLDADDDELED